MMGGSTERSYGELPELKKLASCFEMAGLSTALFASRVSKVEQSTRKQIAVIGLAASAYSVFFGILPLLKSGLLVPAAVLIRAFLERIATIAWLSRGPEDSLNIYLTNWDDPRKRPSIRLRIRHLNNYLGEHLPSQTEEYVIADYLIDNWLNTLHGYTHGDDEHAIRHSIEDDATIAFAAGSDYEHPAECQALANIAVILFGQLHNELELLFPDRVNQNA